MSSWQGNTEIAILLTGVVGALLIYFLLNKKNTLKKQLPAVEIDNESDEVSQIITLSRQFKDAGMYIGRKTIFDTIKSSQTFVTGSAHVECILRDTQLFEKDIELLKFAVPLFGEGVLMSHGDMHTLQRKILNPVFSPQQLKKYVPTIQQHTQKLVQLWRNEISDITDDGKRIVVSDWLTNLSFDIISEVGFGYQMNAQDSRSSGMNEFSQALNDQFENQSQSTLYKVLIFLFYFLPRLRPVLKFVNLFVKGENQIVTQTMTKLIAKRKEELLNEKVPETQNRDFLSVLLNAQLADARITDKLIRDNIYTLLVGGQGTTRTALTWMLFALGEYAEVQVKLRAEIESQLGDHMESFTYEQIKQCVYLECFVKEALRFYPPIPFFGRKNVHISANVLGVQLARGSSVLIDINGTHRNQEHYKDADKFHPERFMPGNAIGSINYLPFGNGVYNCIGRNFAMTSMKTILVLLIRNFEFSIDERDAHPVRQMSVETYTKQPLFIRVKKVLASNQ